MKFMNWSYSDLMEAPDDIVREIVRMMNDKIQSDTEDETMAELQRLASEGIR